MILLFVVGVMNLLGIAAIAIFVLLEKVTRFGQLIGRVGALLFILCGITIMATA
jgi:predicted metal-binding membrane protein